MDARREAQRISGIYASFATTQTRFLAATRRDGACWAHFCVVRPRHSPAMAAGSRLELHPTRRRRISENKSDSLLVNRIPDHMPIAVAFPLQAHGFGTGLFAERRAEIDMRINALRRTRERGVEFGVDH